MLKTINAQTETSTRFMIAVQLDSMSSYPDFVREPGDRFIEELANEVRAQGWLVLHRDTRSPTADKPNRVVRTFYIPKFSLITMSGDIHMGTDISRDKLRRASRR
jgi:hypothetical protein